MLDYDIVVSSNTSYTIYYFHFQTNTLGKGLEPFIP